VTAVDDEEDDRGTQMIVSWQAPPEGAGPAGLELVGCRVLTGHPGQELTRGPLIGPDEEQVATVGELRPWPWKPYQVQVAAIYVPDPSAVQTNEDGAIVNPGARRVFSDAIGPVQPVGLWYDPERTNVLVLMLVYSAIVILTIAHARRRAEEMYIRPIAGLEAVDDAIGRATEMGKPILYVSGLTGISSISTIASMLILGNLSRRTAHYETDIIVPCYDSLVMAAEREIVHQAYLEAGKPEAFKPENIFYVTDSQFGYVAAVDGIMVREKPAACFYMGYFYAEALILAETGNETGAIQIAGTDADTQLPFFITACDYTLMGEELYATSAYLSRQPLLVAQLRGQDIGKMVFGALLLAGAIAGTLAVYGSQIAERFLAWFSV
jgi:hypothetical protein